MCVNANASSMNIQVAVIDARSAICAGPFNCTFYLYAKSKNFKLHSLELKIKEIYNILYKINIHNETGSMM